MTPETAQVGFRSAYYRFAAHDWRTELTTDFGRLRRFTSGFAYRALTMFDGLSPKERDDLAAGLLHRGHPEAASQLGLQLTSGQAAFLQAREADVRERLEDEATVPPASRLKRSHLAKILKSKMKSLGDLEPMGSSTWRYRTNLGQLVVLTYLDVGGRIWDLSYHHDVLLGEVRIHRFASFLAWLGVGASKWTLQSEEEAAQATDLLQELCSHFVAALPEFQAEM